MSELHRDAFLTFTLDDGPWEAAVLRDVVLEEGDDGVVGRWPRFGFHAEGVDASEVYRDLLSSLTQRVGNDPSSPTHRPLTALVKSMGRRIDAAEVIRREDAWLRQLVIPWSVGDRQYTVALFGDAVVERHAGGVTMAVLGFSVTAADFLGAFDALRVALAAPQPRGVRAGVADVSSWVERHGQPISHEAVSESNDQARALRSSHDALPDFEVREMERESHVRPVLVQFWGDDCSWCLVQAPVVTEIAEQMAGSIAVGKMHAGRDPDAARRYSIHSVPTLLLIIDGVEVHRIRGHRGVRTILAELEPHLNPPR